MNSNTQEEQDTDFHLNEDFLEFLKTIPRFNELHEEHKKLKKDIDKSRLYYLPLLNNTEYGTNKWKAYNKILCQKQSLYDYNHITLRRLIYNKKNEFKCNENNNK